MNEENRQLRGADCFGELSPPKFGQTPSYELSYNIRVGRACFALISRLSVGQDSDLSIFRGVDIADKTAEKKKRKKNQSAILRGNQRPPVLPEATPAKFQFPSNPSSYSSSLYIKPRILISISCNFQRLITSTVHRFVKTF